MTTDPGPAPRPLLPLRAAPGTETGTDRAEPRPAPVPDVSTEGGTAVLAPVGTPVLSSTATRAGTALRYHVRELWLNPGRLIHSAWNGRPESMAQHYAYMTSREWVPAELTGKTAAAVTLAGLVYHILIARPLKAFAKALDAAAGRPLLMLGLAVPVLILVLLFAL
jgi:hypothetical protein